MNSFTFTDIFTNIFPLLFMLVFIFFIIVFVYSMVKGLSQMRKNNNSPRLTVEAQIVTKRAQHYHRNNGSSTRYFVTFQVESGDRLELQVNDWEYGQLVEGDSGKLHFQGTRYLGFDRTSL